MNSLEAVEAPIQINSLKSKSRKKCKMIISVGKKDKVEVNHIVCAISEATGLNAKEIGKITILDNKSVVEIPEDIKTTILKNMAKTTIKKKTIKVSIEKSDKKRRR